MATSGKSGRKAKAGARYKCGKLRPTRDLGNDRVAALNGLYRPFQDGKADPWVRESAIGRAWAVGLLDGHDVDAAALRDAGLDYAARYWNYYPSCGGVSNYDREDRRGRGLVGIHDPGGEAFQRLDRGIRDSGRASYKAVQALVIDHYWFPHDNPVWLERLINGRLAAAGRAVSGGLPLPGDAETLRSAVEGLLGIVRGRRRRPG